MPQSPPDHRTKISSRQLGAIAILFAAGFLLAVAKAAVLPMWFDELLTFYVSKLEGPSEIWRALEGTADGNPPLLYLLTHWSHLLFGESELATRAPSLAALAIVSWAFYTWLADRLGPVYGVLGTALLWSTNLFGYSFEARPFALVTALTALALLLWRRSIETRSNRLPYLAGLSIVIACAMASHYYAAFAFIALAAGEVARLVRRKRPDWGVWMAGGIGAATLLFYLPLLQAVRAAYSGGFWRLVDETDLLSFYVFFVMAPAGWALLAIFLYLIFLTRGQADSHVAGPSPFLMEERAAMWALALSPTVIAIVAMWTTQAYVLRYALPAMLGLVWGIVMMVWNVTRGARRPAWVATLIVTPLFFYFQGTNVFRTVTKAERTATTKRIFAALDQAEPALTAPLVATSPVNYLPLSHYAPPDWRERLLYLVDPEASLLLKGCDTPDVNLKLLAPWAPIRIADRKKFLEQNDRFLTLTSKPEAPFAWLNDYLEARGAAHQKLIETPNFVLLEYRGVTVETQAELAALAPKQPRCE
jgi:uncharacterized membrane protein